MSCYMNRNMRTKTGLNRPGSPSLKSTIPEGVVSVLHLKPKDTIEWSIEIREGKIIAIVTKVEEERGV